jgi:hypothetical protein
MATNTLREVSRKMKMKCHLRICDSRGARRFCSQHGEYVSCRAHYKSVGCPACRDPMWRAPTASEQWANEQNAQRPPKPPAPVQPPKPVGTEQDQRDLRDGARCLLSDGPFDGMAISSRSGDFYVEERGYAPWELEQFLSGDMFAVYRWDHRRPDGVHVYVFSRKRRESNAP